MKELVRSAVSRLGLEIVQRSRHVTLSTHLEALLPELGADAVFDVGANTGQFARSLRDTGYKGWILSFEPNPVLAEALNVTAASDPRWLVFPYALSAEDGTLTLHVTQRDDLASALPINAYGKAAFGEGMTIVRDVEVPMRRLDTIYEDLRQAYGFARPFLKMDTQGFDLHVLRGAEGVWTSIVGLLTEMSLKPLYEGMPDATESLDAVRDAGFDVSGVYAVSSDPSGALIELDCVARRRA